MFGYDSPHDFLSSVDDIANIYVRPEERPEILQEIDEKGFVKGKEVEFLRKNGESFWVKLYTSSFRDKDKVIYEGLMEDITERKLVEEAFRQSEQKYRTLVEESFDGIFVQKGSKIIFTNQRLNEILGYEEGELLGLDHWLLYPPEYQDLTRTRAQARMRGEKITSHYEVKLQRKDGSWLYGEVLARVINFEGELGIQVWVRDITERKQAEELLRESEETHRILFESSKDAIYISTREGNIVEANPSHLDLFGYSRKEISDWNAKDSYVNPDDRSRFRKEIEVNGSVKDFEVKLRKKDGAEMDCLITAAVRRSKDGNIVGYQGIIRDVTELKRAQEERERLICQLQDALAKVKTLSGLLPICSHCKKIRDDKGYWNQIESYIHKHSDAEFSHGICPECVKKYYPDIAAVQLKE